MLQIHVILSLVGILTGFVVLYGLVTGVSSRGWTAIFLATTILTSVTGFPLSPFGFDPPRAVGVISLVLLALALGALYAFRLAGAWRWIYVGAAVAALASALVRAGANSVRASVPGEPNRSASQPSSLWGWSRR